MLGAAIAAPARAAVNRVTCVGAARPVVGVANPLAATRALDRPVSMNDHRPRTSRVRRVVHTRDEHEGAELTLRLALLDRGASLT